MRIDQTITNFCNGQAPIAMYPVLCRRHRGTTVSEEVHVAYLSEVEGERFVGFYPGVTGHESFYLQSGQEAVAAKKEEVKDKLTVFGQPAFEFESWSLNAGSDVYDKLDCTYGDIEELLNMFAEVE